MTHSVIIYTVLYKSSIISILIIGQFASNIFASFSWYGGQLRVIPHDRSSIYHHGWWSRGPHSTLYLEFYCVSAQYPPFEYMSNVGQSSQNYNSGGFYIKQASTNTVIYSEYRPRQDDGYRWYDEIYIPSLACVSILFNYTTKWCFSNGSILILEAYIMPFIVNNIY